MELKNRREVLVEDGEEVEELEQFCYFGGIIDCEAVVEKAVRRRVAAAKSKWREMSEFW